MIRIAKEDVLRGLKKFKRLAKQDLLASSLTSNPHFWSTQAEARRLEYTELMEIVDNDGVDVAYHQALQRYVSLPRVAPVDAQDPGLSGRKQALEMFFTMLGMEPGTAADGAVVAASSGVLSQA